MPHSTIRAGLAACLFLVGTAAAHAAEPSPSGGPPAQASSRTGKERLGDKASDEQRVDDCKVPLERRTKPRPDVCEWIGS